MQICVTSIPLDTFGGAQRVIVSDATHFAEAGHDVHVLTSNYEKDVVSSYGKLDSITIHQYPLNRTNSIPAQLYHFRYIRGLLNKIQPDAVIAHYVEQETWLAISTLRLSPFFAVHIHGSLFWFEDNTERAVHIQKECAKNIVSEVPGHSEFWSVENIPWIQKIKDNITEYIETIAVQNCDAVFVNTRQVASEIECLYEVSPNVNPPGIDLEQPDEEIKTLPTDEPFIFSVSRLDPRKRIDLLIRAFAELRTERKDIQLVIGGTGDERERLQDLATELGVDNNVVFVGHIDEDQLSKYYSEAEIFACPGWMSYGLTPLEAASLQTKVALSTDAFSKEVIGDERGVRVLPPVVEEWADGLDMLLDYNKFPSKSCVPTTRNHANSKLESLLDIKKSK